MFPYKRTALRSGIPAWWIWFFRRKYTSFVLVLPLVLVTTVLGMTYVRHNTAATMATPHLPKYLGMEDFGFIRNNDTVCSQINSPLIITVIHSARHHFAYRKAIRDTWGSVTAHKNWAIRRVFILGSQDLEVDGPENYNQTLEQEIEKEHIAHGDIIISDFHDSYRNLTIKHLVGYKWVLKYCSNAAFVVKTDDDMFINIFELVSHLSARRDVDASHLREISCHQWEDRPKRYGNDKWRVSHDEYSEDSYPPFCVGAAYITTPTLTRDLYALHSQVRYLWIDDIFVTGLLRAYFNSVMAGGQQSSSTAAAAESASDVGINDIQDLYQLKEDTWESKKIFYLLKRQAGAGMQFNMMDFYWNVTLAHPSSYSREHGQNTVIYAGAPSGPSLCCALNLLIFVTAQFKLYNYHLTIIS